MRFWHALHGVDPPENGSDTVSIWVAPAALPGYIGAKIALDRIPDREDFAG